ncbi:MAG: MBL fold metallo-hydrolase [Phycisphaerales bacterium]
MIDLRVISIGTLGAHPLWGERRPVRTGHATTTLIRTREETILVDPGLPSQALGARLAERANITPDDVTIVFLTSFHLDTHRGIDAFENARWLIHRTEREMVGIPLVSALRHAVEHSDEELRETIEREVAILHRFEEAPESLAEGVDLFPLPGVTPGMCGLLVSTGRDRDGEGPVDLDLPRTDVDRSVLVCGDAIPTVEHLFTGRVLPSAGNVEHAKASFAEAVEIADWLVLGRDNAVPSPGRVAGEARRGDGE